MSKNRDKHKIKIEGGELCPRCRKRMQRFIHSDGWKPVGGRNYYLYWDCCKRCKHVQHYREAFMFNESSMETVK